MDIIKMLGGYDSWQYITVALGFLFIGGGLTAWKAYFLPLPIIGQILLFLLLNNVAKVANISGAAGGIAGILPIIYIACCIIGNFKIMENSFPRSKDKEKPQEEKPTEKTETSAFDPEQFKRKS
jgi:hypothetical protein